MPNHFVCTLPLRTTPRDESVLRKRFSAAHSAYNALLGECLRRLRLMRESRAWRAACRMPKGTDRTKAFRELHIRFGFREYDLYPFIKEQRRCWIGDHIDSRTMMTIASKAFVAVEKWTFKNGGRPHFKRYSDLRSIEAPCSKSPLRWLSESQELIWSGLSLPAVIDPDDDVQAHGLRHRIALARIVRMTIRGQERYYAQLVCEGEPYRKPQHQTTSGTVGLDLGPSAVAVVGDKSARLLRFCDEVEPRRHELRRLQRQEDRQRRINNPECFDERGQWKRGKRARRQSKRMARVSARRVELQRRERTHRKNLHGRLAHQVIALGSDMRMERLSYRGWRVQFGKSVGSRAPGLFVSILKRCAVKLGATVTEFNPRRALCSQTCLCGTLRKKKLSEREHQCACGVKSQRDILSAHLARFCDAKGRLDVGQAAKAWRRLCNAVRASSGIKNGTKVGALALVLPAREAGQSPSHVDARHNPVSGPDVVAGRKAQARAGQKPAEAGAVSSLGTHQGLLWSISGSPQLQDRLPR